MKRPYAYLRKSRVTTDRHVSWEMQEKAVLDLAGTEELTFLSDWNKSGGSDARPGYQQLLAAINAGQVSEVYSYSLSRLSRSLSDFSSLVELCQAKGIPIRLHSERHLDFESASGRLMVNILAAFAQMERELAKERARDTVAVRRARGDRIGPAFFDKPELVLEAYREAGSISGAARILTERKVPTRNGKSYWSPTAVRTIIARTDPKALPRVRERGVKKAAPFRFYRLLRCPYCGRMLTGVRYAVGKNPAYTTYRCLAGRFQVQHDHTTVPETAILAWVRKELALLDPRTDAIQVGEDDRARTNALRERKVRLGRAFVDGLLEEDAYRMELAAIEREVDELELASAVVAIPTIDLDNDKPERVNEVLRALWGHLELDDRMRPVRAHRLTPRFWRDPAPA